MLMSSVWPNTWTSSGLWPDHNCTPVWPMFAATDNTEKTIEVERLLCCSHTLSLLHEFKSTSWGRRAGQDRRVAKVGCFSSRRQIALRKKKALEQLVDRYGSTSQSEA